MFSGYIYLYIANIHYSENFSILGTSPRKRLNYSKTFISKPLLADSFELGIKTFWKNLFVVVSAEKIKGVKLDIDKFLYFRRLNTLHVLFCDCF